MNSSLGTLHTVDGKPVLRFVRRLNHPPQEVWTAVTDPAEMAHWFPATITTELKIGAPMRFSYGDGSINLGEKFQHGEILELDPPKVYAFRWFDSVLRIEIAPDGTGCLLYFSQAFSGVPTWGDFPSVARQAPGWHACLSALTAHLDDQPAPTIDQKWFLEYSERYIDVFELGEGTVRAGRDGYLLGFERDLVQPVQTVRAALAEFPPPDAAPAGDRADPAQIEVSQQEPIGTRLVVTQTVPAGSAAPALAQWHAYLEFLFAALQGDVRPRNAERIQELTTHYRAAEGHR